MKPVLLFLIAFFAIFQNAAAADLGALGSIKDDARPSFNAFSRWSGAYFGVQAGGELAIDDLSLSYNGTPITNGYVAAICWRRSRWIPSSYSGFRRGR
jgi:hypothetical protein